MYGETIDVQNKPKNQVRYLIINKYFTIQLEKNLSKYVFTMHFIILIGLIGQLQLFLNFVKAFETVRCKP